MGLIGRIFGGAGATRALGQAATGVAEVFVPNATKRMTQRHAAYIAALEAHAAEYRHARTGVFDRAVDALNRLPRPLLALGTLGLFVYAMADPAGFSQRMQGLAHVPEPLWWLLGAVVGFYFGAREMHYLRRPATTPSPAPAPGGPPEDRNAALEDWRRNRDE